jgi:hypothetical protein
LKEEIAVLVDGAATIPSRVSLQIEQFHWAITWMDVCTCAASLGQAKRNSVDHDRETCKLDVGRPSTAVS